MLCRSGSVRFKPVAVPIRGGDRYRTGYGPLPVRNASGISFQLSPVGRRPTLR